MNRNRRNKHAATFGRAWRRKHPRYTPWQRLVRAFADDTGFREWLTEVLTEALRLAEALRTQPTREDYTLAGPTGGDQ